MTLRILTRLTIVVAVLLPVFAGVQPAVATECPAAAGLFERLAAAETDKEALLKKVVGLCPSHGPALNNLGVINEGRGEFRMAERYYRRAIAAGDAGIAPYAGLGDALRARGDEKSAAAAYRQFLAGLEVEISRGDPNGLRSYESEYRSRLKSLLAGERRSSADREKAAPIIGSAVITRSLTTKPIRVRGLAVQWNDKPFVDVQILFDFDSDRIKPGSLVQLREIAASLKNPALRRAQILIAGHTDSVGQEPYNLNLSIRRATAVRRALADQFGIDGARTRIKGYGEGRPVATNETPDGQAKNRRVTFVNSSWK